MNEGKALRNLPYKDFVTLPLGLEKRPKRKWFEFWMRLWK